MKTPLHPVFAIVIFSTLVWATLCWPQMPEHTASHHHEGTHQDHNPKHGGTFFMAMDNKHHLEGVLVSPGIFRVYLYDAYTHPLPSAKVKQARGAVQLGDSPNAPTMPLAPAKDGTTLEVALGRITFPFTLTLRMHFPDTPADAKPELFTFPFSHYMGGDDHHQSNTRAEDMEGMKMDHSGHEMK